MVIASKVSATPMIRATRGISSPSSRSGYPVAVPGLVVIADTGNDVLEHSDRGHDLGADVRVLPHDGELLVGESAGFVEDAVANAELADVVEDGRDADAEDLLLVESKVFGDGHGVGAHPLRMASCVGVLGVDRRRESADGLEEQLLVLPQSLLEAADQGLDTARHVVEVAGKLCDFVLAVEVDRAARFPSAISERDSGEVLQRDG